MMKAVADGVDVMTFPEMIFKIPEFVLDNLIAQPTS